MATPWTQDEISFLQSSLHLETADIALAFNARVGQQVRSYDSIQKKVKQLRGVYSPDADPQNPAVITEIPSSDVEILAETEEEELFVPTSQVALKIAQWLKEASNNYKPRKSEPVSTNGVSLVIALSDNHFGKKTEDFNLEVARERVLSMVQGILDGGGPLDRIDEVILALAGDEVEGEDIYSNQNGSLECPVIYQVKAAVEAYWDLCLDLRETFQVRVRVVTCPGNHGRMSKTASTESNWDNVIYMQLALLAQANPELDIQVDMNFKDFALFEVKGKIGCAYHYGTKHLGTPAMTSKMAGWILSKNIDFLIHGHWHHWGVETYLGTPMMHNGCMCGPDDLAEKMAVEEPPRQGYFFVERDRPIRTFCFVEW